jgi:hypothetical protein
VMRVPSQVVLRRSSSGMPPSGRIIETPSPHRAQIAPLMRSNASAHHPVGFGRGAQIQFQVAAVMQVVGDVLPRIGDHRTPIVTAARGKSRPTANW